MSEQLPIHHLAANLETERLQAVQELAAKGGALPADALEKIATLQATLTAVREEIKAHNVKIGHGSEDPLA